MTREQFAHYRTTLGKSQKVLAGLLGVSLKAVQSYEQGWRSVPTHVERQLCFLLVSRKGEGATDTSKVPNNYFKDNPSWQLWHELLDKYPQDDAIHALYATRRGLCTMVESGQIDLDRASRIFESMRKSLVDRYREYEGAVERMRESLVDRNREYEEAEQEEDFWKI